MKKLFQNLRASSQIVRFRIQGPINSKSEHQLTQSLNQIQQIRSDALLVIINSYGGSLQSAKNISARLKKLSLNKQIPLYCFAEQFCLNSANIILTAGTKCFAHKFSTIGDFGFVYEGIDTQELQKQLNIRQKHITTMKNTYKTNWLTQNISPNDKNFIEKLLKQSQQNLKQQIIHNRKNSLNKLQQEQFDGFMKSEGFFDVQSCVERGLVDGICGIEEWIMQNQKGKRIVEGTGQAFQNPAIQWIRQLKDSFKYREQ